MAVISQIAGAGVRFTFELEGFEKVDVGLSRFGDDLQDWREFFEKYVGPQFFGDIQSNFRTQGAYVYSRSHGIVGSGSFGGWPPLSARYAAWKAKVYPGQPLMVLTGRLRQSLDPNSPNSDQIRTIRPLEAVFGTAVPYAAAHQTGIPGRLPQRRVVFLASSETYGRLAHRYIIDVHRGRRVAA